MIAAPHTPELEEADRQDDLPLGNLGDGVPQRLRRHAARRLVAASELPREFDVVRVHDVANERRHRDTAVLDLSLPQEADRRRVGIAPELAARQVERIPEAHHRVQLRAEHTQDRTGQPSM